MDCVPYSRLARYYDEGWGGFAESSLRFVLSSLVKYGIESGRILELACGTGSLAHHLAGCGYEVHGVDRSAEMIALARDKGWQGPRAVFSVGDMRDLHSEIHHDLDAVLCLFDSVNYLMDERDIKAVMTFISTALRPGGAFIFDFNRPIIYAAHHGETMVRKIDSGTLRMEMEYDAADRIATTTFRFPNGDIETHVQRALELEDLEPLLDGLALPLVACYSDFTCRPVSSISERLICVCRKQ